MSFLKGILKPVPNFEGLGEKLPQGSLEQKTYDLLFHATQDLGDAVKLNRHRELIDSLDEKLNLSTLIATASLVANDEEACSIFSTFLTTLEQAYHWPRPDGMSLFLFPETLGDHKLLVQVLHQEELRSLLPDYDTEDPEEIASTVLDFAHNLLDEACAARMGRLPPLPEAKQDLVNLLYRTARGDWDDQGCYNDVLSHLEFGHLHETKRTNGGQRSTMEVFQRHNGTARLNEIALLLPYAAKTKGDIAVRTSQAIRRALAELQLAVAAVHDELFDFMLDEPIWGRCFAVWSKGVGFSTIGAGGADTATPFRCVDAMIGTVGDPGSSALLVELLFRSRHFPLTYRKLIEKLGSAKPHLRTLAGRACEENAALPTGELFLLRAAFTAFLGRQHELFSMHTKKAMRIALALRAGQSKTSSGVQNASKPEVHIAHALTHAVRVRFGQNAQDDLQIQALTSAFPMFYEEDGTIGSARVRFYLNTEVVVRPGDTISVRVRINNEFGGGGRWERRTYSVVCAGTEEDYSDALASTHSTATWIEVAIRKSGLVSTLLVNQPQHKPSSSWYSSLAPSPTGATYHSSGICVQLSVKPAAHFRLKGNVINRTETLFVSQGGACGIFLGWLRWQDPSNLPGSYRVIIAARNIKHLSFVQLLEAVIRKWAPSRKLRIVIAFSRQRMLTPWHISMMHGVTVYSGYANEYLKGLPESDKNFSTTYVCGSAAFGLGIVRCLEEEKHINRFSNIPAAHARTYAPITTSTLPPLRLHVAEGSVRADPAPSEHRCISPAELALHNAPGNMWMAVGNKVYDISLLDTFHPGGSKVITYSSGKQAGEVFRSVHGGDGNTELSHEVAAMLGQMEIGDLVPFTIPAGLQMQLTVNPVADNIWESSLLTQIVDIQNDLANHSRFEQRPLGTVEQLPFAPPADCIRGAMDVFVRAWTAFARSVLRKEWEEGLSHVAALGVVHDENNAVLDDFQKIAWARDDKARTARGLKAIFDVHLDTIERIHGVIDGMKTAVWGSLRTGEVLSPEKVVGEATRDIFQAMGKIGRERDWMVALERV